MGFHHILKPKESTQKWGSNHDRQICELTSYQLHYTTVHIQHSYWLEISPAAQHSIWCDLMPYVLQVLICSVPIISDTKSSRSSVFRFSRPLHIAQISLFCAYHSTVSAIHHTLFITHFINSSISRGSSNVIITCDPDLSSYPTRVLMWSFTMSNRISGGCHPISYPSSLSDVLKGDSNKSSNLMKSVSMSANNVNMSASNVSGEIVKAYGELNELITAYEGSDSEGISVAEDALDQMEYQVCKILTGLWKIYNEFHAVCWKKLWIT